MGISYELYNAPDEKAMMNQWDKAYSLPIDTPDNVKNKLSLKYPSIDKWEVSDTISPRTPSPYIRHHWALGSNNCNSREEYIEITLVEHIDGYIHWISVSRGSPKLVSEIQKLFSIKFVFEGQSCSLLDPSKYKGNWEPISESL